MRISDWSSDVCSSDLSLTDSFTVTVTDDEGATTTQAVTITVLGTNDAPVISSAVQAGTVTEDGSLTATGQVTATDVDHDAVLSYSVNTTTGSYGSLVPDTAPGAWPYPLTNDPTLPANNQTAQTRVGKEGVRTGRTRCTP